MNEKFQPAGEMFDDVEGHLARVKLNADENEDVQGHASRAKVALPQEPAEDTEGHMPYRKADAEDDTEGHGRRGPIAAEELPENDTEGHRWRMGALPADPTSDDDGDDTEGHAAKCK